MARGETYEQFVEKFKPKKTTDDCYTPDNVYKAVLDWVCTEYSIDPEEVIRPFWPGGDYENEDYTGKVVIDNPPFSIFSKICRFYRERKIKYFLFAPGLTLFSTNSGKENYVITDSSIRYENGAVVNSGFVTNLGKYKIRIEPELNHILKEVQKTEKEKPKYVLPENVITPSILGRAIRNGRTVKLLDCEVQFTRSLDEQKRMGKALYGAGFFISDAAREKIFVKKENGKSRKCSCEDADCLDKYVFKLSQREEKIIEKLNEAR